MAATAGTAYWMATSDTFTLDEAVVSGELRYTDGAALLAAAGLDRPRNVLVLDTGAARAKMLEFVSVADADVRVTLPNHVEVAVDEREPVFALRHEGDNLLVDERGAIVASVGDTEAESLGVPIVRDDRAEWALDLAIGGTVDPIDLAAILQLAAADPAAIGSSATALSIAVDDDNGYVVTAQPNGWRAIFGHYTPTLRPPDLVPRQMQCLRSLLAGGEQTIDTVYLAPLDERCGTYLPRETPRVAPTPDPSASARM